MSAEPIPPPVELPPEVADYVQVLRAIDQRRKQLDTYAEIAETHIKNALGDSEIGNVNGQPVVYWRHVKGKTTTDYRRLRIDHPEIVPLLQAYTKVGNPSRRFTLADAAAATPPASGAP
ncbi:hypothetical protein GCM10010156_49320 [Planobispora rosea]|uniref:Uncharacterized protein n=1 Tax=Planobispora rosea TaxID=35762 RepID=A0A8J3SAU7_PLARO|nr:hypothetical protein [Planobispora rosea]GGS84835.1 hypothetical protein GCM10010156_49320 [Planobispora rosea]GIH86443.1 hypothetical protein Pro02_48510 [Planobispora rosea]